MQVKNIPLMWNADCLLKSVWCEYWIECHATHVFLDYKHY